MDVRPAGFDDIPLLRYLLRELLAERQAASGPSYPFFGDDDLDASVTFWADYLGTPGLGVWMAISPAGTPLGFLQVQLHARPFGEPRRFGHCDWMFTLREVRGQGIGRQLIQAGGAWLLANGIAFVEVQSLPKDDQWVRRGFKPVALHAAMLVQDAVAAVCAPRTVEAPQAVPAAAQSEADAPVPAGPAAPPATTAASQGTPRKRRKAPKRRRAVKGRAKLTRIAPSPEPAP